MILLSPRLDYGLLYNFLILIDSVFSSGWTLTWQLASYQSLTVALDLTFL